MSWIDAIIWTLLVTQYCCHWVSQHTCTAGEGCKLCELLITHNHLKIICLKMNEIFSFKISDFFLDDSICVCIYIIYLFIYISMEWKYLIICLVILTRIQSFKVGQDSVVSIATRYGLDSLGIESRWGRDFPHASRPALRSTQPPVQWVPGHSWG